MGLVPERPRVDHPVDRPELYEPRGSQVTGTNGRLLDHFYRSSLQEGVRRTSIDGVAKKKNPDPSLDRGSIVNAGSDLLSR
jgi:hypothetical protein